MMSGYDNGGQQPVRVPAMPEPGRGRARKATKKTEKSPDFRGIVNVNGQAMSISMWFEAGRTGPTGIVPDSFSVAIQPYVGEVGPPAPSKNGGYSHQPQTYAQPQQQPMQYGAPQPQQYAPQQQWAPQQQAAPQYAPQQAAPQAQRSYQPAPQATQPPPYQPPAAPVYGAPQAHQAPNGGGGAPAYRGVAPDEIPFAAEFR